jgi:hypothetical protein
MMNATVVRHFSLDVLLVCFCLWLCRVYGYFEVPLWTILIPVALVVAFWAVALLLAFIVWVVVVLRQAEKQIQDELQDEE